MCVHRGVHRQQCIVWTMLNRTIKKSKTVQMRVLFFYNTVVYSKEYFIQIQYLSFPFSFETAVLFF